MSEKACLLSEPAKRALIALKARDRVTWPEFAESIGMEADALLPILKRSRGVGTLSLLRLSAVLPGWTAGKIVDDPRLHAENLISAASGQ